jgi:hypothetical protein
MSVRLIAKKGSTFHDLPYSSPERKCLHCWIINVTPPGPNQCLHGCIYCYAREAIYSNYSGDTLIYNNLPEFVERDLNKGIKVGFVAANKAVMMKKAIAILRLNGLTQP